MNTQPILTPKETSSPQRHGRRTSRIQAPICLSLLIAIGAIPVAANTLYLTGFNNNASQQYSTFAIDTVTGQVTNQWPDINSHDTSNFCCGEFAIAVDKTIRKIGISNGERWSQLGSQYTLKGTFTGTTYSNPLPVSVPPAFSGIFDATTDGVHNYFVDVGSGTVYRTDRD